MPTKLNSDNWEFWDSAARWTPEDGWCTPDWTNARMFLDWDESEGDQ